MLNKCYFFLGTFFTANCLILKTPESANSRPGVSNLTSNSNLSQDYFPENILSVLFDFNEINSGVMSCEI